MSPRDVYAAFLDMQQKRELLSVTTGKRVYKNMLIKGIEVTTDKTTENVLSILTLREVILINPKNTGSGQSGYGAGRKYRRIEKRAALSR
jgi:hypothetical protein